MTLEDYWRTYWKPGEYMDFTNALRHCLGLQPLFNANHEDNNLYTWRIPIYDGNRRISSKGSSL